MTAETPAGLRVKVGDVTLHPLVTSPADATIADAARRMAEAASDSLVSLDEDGRPVGILTDADLGRRVVAAGLDPATKLASVLSTPVMTIDGAAAGFQAVAQMLEQRIHHLVVVDADRRAVGVLAWGDLLAVESSGPLLLAHRIENAGTIGELASARASYPATADLLLDAGAQSTTVLAILAEANDRLQRRLLELAAVDLGPAPAPFAWLVMGSEGRRTQTLRTDQDNGVVWAEGNAPDPYFAALSIWMVDALERIGFPRCRGDVMATNELWRGSLEIWRRRFGRWLEEPEPTALLNALIAFDFRAVGGDAAIAGELRTWLMSRTPQARMLLIHCARDVLRGRPPLAPLGRMRLDRAGAFDAKSEAIGIIVASARLFALELGLEATSTLERLAVAGARGVVPPDDAAEIAAAYRALQLIRLRRQVAAATRGMAPDNMIVPRELGRADRAALREHLSAIERLQHGVADRYGATVSVS